MKNKKWCPMQITSEKNQQNRTAYQFFVKIDILFKNPLVILNNMHYNKRHIN